MSVTVCGRFPATNSFRRYRDELALESPQSDTPHRWLAVRANTLRTGTVNPQRMPEAYALHRHVLEAAPAYLSITALDIDHIELLYGFDLLAGGNHDAIVLEALMQGSPMSALMDIPGASPTDCQPVVGFNLGEKGETEVHFEVKTRPPANQPRDPEGQDPISVYLILRRFGPVQDIKDLERIRKEKRHQLFREQDDLETRKDRLMEDIQGRLNRQLQREHLFLLRWKLEGE